MTIPLIITLVSLFVCLASVVVTWRANLKTQKHIDEMRRIGLQIKAERDKSVANLRDIFARREHTMSPKLATEIREFLARVGK